jgi:uncharacterized membrane protein
MTVKYADTTDLQAGTSPLLQQSTTRLTGVDALRGLVMVIMALDHVRDFFHDGAMVFSPEDLTRTTPILFFTRWITHVCAPAFVFLAGVGAFLRFRRDGSKWQLSRFLLIRGLWLVFLEVTVMRLAFNFTFALQYPVLLLVLWALGVSMMALAVLIHLPTRVLALSSITVIGLHNLFDGFQASQFGALSAAWTILHQPGVFTLAGMPFVVGYPVLPWVAVMAAGFCFGELYSLSPVDRRRVIATIGMTLIVLFVLLRIINVYGDPSPWSYQESALFTTLSFLRTTKYPPSLDFILMTLGPAFLALAYLEWRRPGANHPLVVIGRVPLFYFVVHFWAIHLLSSFMAWLRYGNASFAFLFSPLPSMGGPRELFPPDFGYPLWVVYVVWIGIVLLLYPLCRWFADLKARRKSWWLSYL